MTDSIVMFMTDNDIVNVFSEQMRKRFEELGLDVFLFDISDSVNNLGRLYEYLSELHVIAMIGFNSNFFGLKTPGGANVWETLGIPCINILVDHPFWYHKILNNMGKNGMVLCIDRNHMSYVNRFYPNIPINGFLAHGGTRCEDYIPINNRKIPILYAGSYYADYADIQKTNLSIWDFDAKAIADDTTDYLLANPNNTIEAVLEKMLLDREIVLGDDRLRVFVSSCSYIERIVSSHFRNLILENAVESGEHLVLYGNGWDKCRWIHKSNVEYRGFVASGDILPLMGDTRIVLNSMPWFKDGSHERIFNGMINGCVVATDMNPYLYETLDKDAIIGFELNDNDLHSLGKRISDCLSDKDKLSEMSLAARREGEKHSWYARADEIYNDILQAYVTENGK